MAHSSKLALQSVDDGDDGIHRGLFAVAPIAAGEVLWEASPQDPPSLVMTRAEIEAAAPDDRARLQKYSWYRGDGLYETTRTPETDAAWFINHSCDPNCGFDRADRIIALRAITPGEQIAYDYAMTETEESFHVGLRCRCGAATCRGALDFTDWRDPDFVAQRAGAFASHLRARINTARAAPVTRISRPLEPSVARSASASAL